jgi:hypothetical protein
MKPAKNHILLFFVSTCLFLFNKNILASDYANSSYNYSIPSYNITAYKDGDQKEWSNIYGFQTHAENNDLEYRNQVYSSSLRSLNPNESDDEYALGEVELVPIGEGVFLLLTLSLTYILFRRKSHS